MAKSDRPVALVTGASRGAGAGIARALGSYGMRVYVTGRAETVGEARGWDGAALPGTIHSTAAEVTAAGGEGIAVRCDHADDERVQAVFAQIEAESGRLDLLVNNATMIHPELITPKPFWEKPLDAVGILDVGLRSAYVASWHAARIMVPQGWPDRLWVVLWCELLHARSGLRAQKAGIDKFAHDMQHDLSETGVNAVSIWMGPLRTERALMAAEVHPEQYEEIMKVAENPEYTGHLLHALAFGDAIERYAGKTVVGAELGVELGISDAGEYRPSHRDMLGGPPDRSPAVIY